MTKIKVKPIKDNDTTVAINDGLEKIEHIKAQFASMDEELELAEVPVFDMWDNTP